jgi:NAD(P)-dependent dehydrogenase (short-subunit alcohol dehydrogenase family)
MGKIILITGANKGIGYEVAKQLSAAGHTVLVGARHAEAGEKAAASLGGSAQFVKLDVLDKATHEAAAKMIGERFGKLDVLINNAAIAHPEDGSAAEISLSTVETTFATNFFGVIAVTQAMLPMLRKSEAAQVLNVSSELGSVSLHADPAWPYYQVRFMAYCTSKAALNMFTVLLAAELAEAGIKVNVVNPGYTATDLNGNRGFQTVEQGAVEIVRLAQMGADAPTCGYTEAVNKPIAW